MHCGVSRRIRARLVVAGTKHDWRVRVGDYRIIYEIADAIRVVRIYRVRHRREAYR